MRSSRPRAAREACLAARHPSHTKNMSANDHCACACDVVAVAALGVATLAATVADAAGGAIATALVRGPRPESATTRGALAGGSPVTALATARGAGAGAGGG